METKFDNPKTWPKKWQTMLVNVNQAVADLSSKSPASRRKAADVLFKEGRAEGSEFRRFALSSDKVFVKLKSLLGDSDPKVLVSALGAIEIINSRYRKRDPSLLALAAPFIHHKDKWVRLKAYQLANTSKHPKRWDTLKQGLEDRWDFIVNQIKDFQ